MAKTDDIDEDISVPSEKVSIARFEIEGLFGYLDHIIPFPEIESTNSTPNILIVEGQNGTGKTTILNMIEGMLRLDFDEFRRIPFKICLLKLSNGQELSITSSTNDPLFPLTVEFGNHEVVLVRDKNESDRYSEDQIERITNFRSDALSILSTIDFDLISIDRSLRDDTDQDEVNLLYKSQYLGQPRASRRKLTHKVQRFMRDAQVNYRRFFQAEDLELLPRMIGRIRAKKSVDRVELVEKLDQIKDRNDRIKRFGIQTEDADIRSLDSILNDQEYNKDQDALNLISSYIEMHENIAQARDLIVNRLEQFEKIMSEFLVGKTVRVNTKDGLRIEGFDGQKLSENDFSSGEFHFVYMMVAALLCERSGTILAVDEPELSLHVSWQRKLISALSKCASGASPLFLFATHSTAISAAHEDSVIQLNPVD